MFANVRLGDYPCIFIVNVFFIYRSGFSIVIFKNTGGMACAFQQFINIIVLQAAAIIDYILISTVDRTGRTIDFIIGFGYRIGFRYWIAFFNSRNIFTGNVIRYRGWSVRPVRVKK